MIVSEESPNHKRRSSDTPYTQEWFSEILKFVIIGVGSTVLSVYITTIRLQDSIDGLETKVVALEKRLSDHEVVVFRLTRMEENQEGLKKGQEVLSKELESRLDAIKDMIYNHDQRYMEAHGPNGKFPK